MPVRDDFNDDRQRVLDATDIVRLVGEHCALKPRGREFVCLCPFHDDHSPSMYVVPTKQIYHCFSCGAGGNAIDFVINYHKLPFREALEFLANRSGVTLTPPKRRERGADSPDDAGVSKAELAAVNEFACGFFRAIFRHETHGSLARETAERRGFTPETIESFAIGASPDRWDGLVAAAQKRNVSMAALQAAGLVKERSSGPGVYDALRNRLIFPIHDQLGRVIAFGGRKLKDEDEPKYLNSPETALFDKSSTLYGLHHAARSIQRENVAIVTEGYTDAIACHQAGFTNVVATLGTALTARHAAMLRRLCDTVVLLFDADEAGAKAADRALEVFFAQPIDVKIAVVAGGKDPADILGEPGGADRFRASIDGATDALEYRFERLRERLASMGEAARARAIEDDIQRLVEMGLARLSPVRRRMVVQRLARVARIPEDAILSAIPQAGSAKARVAGRGDGQPAAPGARGPSHALEHALGCLLAAPTLAGDLEAEDRARLAPGAMADAALRAIAEAVEAGLAASPTDPDDAARAALAAIADSETRVRATALVQGVEHQCDGNRDRIDQHLRACLKRLRLDELAEPRVEMAPEVDGASDPAKHPRPLDQELDQQLAALRLRQQLGGDQRAMPRPPASART
ncbi:MAG: DNA primase [Phycisphaerales bacterium]